MNMKLLSPIFCAIGIQTNLLKLYKHAHENVYVSAQVRASGSVINQII